MNTICGTTTFIGRGQVKGLYQANGKGFELHIITSFGRGAHSMEGNLYAILTSDQCKAIAEHLTEFSKNKPIAVNFSADIIGVRPSDASTRSEDRTAPKLHLDVSLFGFTVEISDGMWK